MKLLELSANDTNYLNHAHTCSHTRSHTRSRFADHLALRAPLQCRGIAGACAVYNNLMKRVRLIPMSLTTAFLRVKNEFHRVEIWKACLSCNFVQLCGSLQFYLTHNPHYAPAILSNSAISASSFACSAVKKKSSATSCMHL